MRWNLQDFEGENGLSEAEKSNSVVMAMHAAMDDAKNARDDRIPPYLKDNSYGSKDDKAQKANYKYPHDYGGYVEQQYLPNKLLGKEYYKPTNNGFEKTVKEIRKNKTGK